MEYLRKRGYPVAYGINGDSKASAQIQHADLVVIHRLAWKPEDRGNAFAWRDLLHRNGKALCYELDDDLISEAIIERVQKTNMREPLTNEQIDLERQQHIFAIALSDGVICSTEYLRQVCLQYTDKPVVVVPNAIDLQRFQLLLNIEAPTLDRPPTIAWIGGNRPDRDAETLAVAWNRIARKYPSVRFKIGGYPLPALLGSVPADRVSLIPWRSIDAYPRAFANIDIGCAPLNHEPFNLAKSPIKAMEYAAAGAAVVASPTVYSNILEDGRTGFICQTADEWTQALEFLLDNPDSRKKMAQALLEEVSARHSLQAVAGRWPEAWNAIMADFRLRQIKSEPRWGSTFHPSMGYHTTSIPAVRV